MLVSFIGPDMTGKSNIAEALSVDLDIPVFKNQGEWKVKLNSQDYYENLLRYGGTFLMDFLTQIQPSAILDRFYPCEYAYSRAFGRETDDEIIFDLDDKFSSIGGKFIFCKRKNYEGLVDDLFPESLGPQRLRLIESFYNQFLVKTRCDFLTLETDNMDLEEQLRKIKTFLGVK